mmetsp:Transcript_15760/g.16507  ORF Transcript_15760/g.16507 Transcript_15760/m.16507 type:complete len:226 (+) Transcript_15760:520-1197(+)
MKLNKWFLKFMVHVDYIMIYKKLFKNWIVIKMVKFQDKSFNQLPPYFQHCYFLLMKFKLFFNKRLVVKNFGEIKHYNHKIYFVIQKLQHYLQERKLFKRKNVEKHKLQNIKRNKLLLLKNDHLKIQVHMVLMMIVNLKMLEMIIKMMKIKKILVVWIIFHLETMEFQEIHQMMNHNHLMHPQIMVLQRKKELLQIKEMEVIMEVMVVMVVKEEHQIEDQQKNQIN